MAARRPPRSWRETSQAVAQLEAADRARQTAAERFSDAIAQMAGTTWFVGTPRRLVRGVDRLEHRARARLAAHRSVSLQFPHVGRLSRGDLSHALRPDQPEHPHPAERAPSAPRPPGQPLGGAGIDEDGGAAGADRARARHLAPVRLRRSRSSPPRPTSARWSARWTACSPAIRVGPIPRLRKDPAHDPEREPVPDRPNGAVRGGA